MLRWFQRLHRRRHLERDLAAELALHLEMQAEANRAAGMPEAEAIAAARRQFGPIESIKEACRDQRRFGWIEDTGRDLRQVARSLRRAPGFTASALAILALSIAAVAIVGMYYAGFVLSDPPYLRDPARAVALLVRGEKQTGGERPVSMVDYLEWRERLTTLDALAAYVSLGGPVSAGGRHDFASGLGVSGNFFEILGVQPALGRPLVPADYEEKAPRVVIISHRFWQERFGGAADVLGRQLTFYRTPATIVGVMPPHFDFPSQASYWLPADHRVASFENRTELRTFLFGRLRPGVSRAAANAQAAAVVAATAPLPQSGGEHRTAAVVPLRDRFNTSFASQARLFLGSALAVQVLAALNLAGLLFARGLTLLPRRALKAALGASRGRLLREAMAEAALLAVGGVVAGIALAFTVRPAVIAALAPEWPFPSWWRFELSPPVLGFTALVALLTVIGFAALPAWRSTGLALAHHIRGVNASHGGSHTARRLRAFGVGFQLAAALALLIGASLAVQNARALSRIPLGIDPDDVGFITIADLDVAEHGGERFLQTVLRAAADVPGVTAAGMADGMPGEFTGWAQPIAVQTRDGSATIEAVTVRSITPAMLDVFRLPLLQGRNFSPADATAVAPVVLIDRTLAEKAFPGLDPLGQRISTALPGQPPVWATVVGVVGPTRQNPFKDVAPMIYRPLFAGSWLSNTGLYVRTRGDPAAVLDALIAIARGAAPRVSIAHRLDGRYATLVRSTYWQARFFGRVMTGFAVLAFVIAAVGIYGLIAYHVAQRTHEIGVRLALGATPRRVVREFVCWGLKIALVGAAAGLVLALATLGWFVRGFKTTPLDHALACAAAVLLLIVAALIACWLPARRAAGVDPLRALKAE